MALCLACLSAETKPTLVMCRPCYDEHQDVVHEVQGEPITPAFLRRKIWGQRFTKNRTPENRARIAFAAYLLAQSGKDELLTEIRAAFPQQRQSVPFEQEPKWSDYDSLASEANAVNALEAALGRMDHARQQSPGGFRTKDGHWVRSKSEREIAHFLFDNRITFQYERRVTVGGIDMYPDFFLPDVPDSQGMYLEHFGRLDDPRYLDLARRKAQLFREEGLRLIATDEQDAVDLETALRHKLAPLVPSLRFR